MKRLHLERIELVPGECDLGGGLQEKKEKPVRLQKIIMTVA
jgi:hypothetical protein